MLKVPLHAFKNLRKLGLVRSDTCAWESVVYGSRRHDALVIYTLIGHIRLDKVLFDS